MASEVRWEPWELTLQADDAGALRPAAPPPLLEGEVHLWRIPLPAPLSDQAPAAERLQAPLPTTLFSLLSEEERTRAARFHFERDRACFITGRASLRILLGGYLARAPETLRFAYGEAGKPRLADDPPLSFNLSHSGSWGLCGFSRGRLRLGVDVERGRPAADLAAIAERFFSPRERVALAALPGTRRTQGFYRAWTCKEALLKAHGGGLSLPLEDFDVELDPGRPAALLGARGVLAAERFSLQAISLDEDHPGALALEGRPASLRALSLGARPPRAQAHSDAPRARDHERESGKS